MKTRSNILQLREARKKIDALIAACRGDTSKCECENLPGVDLYVSTWIRPLILDVLKDLDAHQLKLWEAQERRKQQRDQESKNFSVRHLEAD